MPVYNQEPFLEKALESMCNQTFRDFELIIVNDGSTDSSGEIIERYVARNPNFRCIVQPNRGVAAARQAGIESAEGNYMIHVDPDDWAEPDYLRLLHEKAVESGADIILCNYTEEYRKKTVKVDVDRYDVRDLDDFKELTAHVIWSSLWNRLIRSECIKGKVEFEPGLNYQEDRAFFYRVLQNASTVAFVGEYLYHYNRHNRNSMVNNQSKSNLRQMWLASRLILDSEKDPAMRNKLEDFLSAENLVFDLLRYPGVTEREFFEWTLPFHRNILRRLENDVNKYLKKGAFKKYMRARRILRILKNA